MLAWFSLVLCKTGFQIKESLEHAISVTTHMSVCLCGDKLFCLFYFEILEGF